MRDIVYSDIGKTIAEPELFNEDSVLESFDNILENEALDVLFNEAGANLEGLLFRPMTPESGLLIRQRVTKKVEFWDDRIKISGSSRVISRPDSQMYDLKVEAKIKGLGYTDFNRLIPHEL